MNKQKSNIDNNTNGFVERLYTLTIEYLCNGNPQSIKSFIRRVPSEHRQPLDYKTSCPATTGVKTSVFLHDNQKMTVDNTVSAEDKMNKRKI